MARAAPRNDRCYPQPHVAIPRPAPRSPARRSHARYWSDHRGRRAVDFGIAPVVRDPKNLSDRFRRFIGPDEIGG